jgi:hypothetical protein
MYYTLSSLKSTQKPKVGTSIARHLIFSRERCGLLVITSASYLGTFWYESSCTDRTILVSVLCFSPLPSWEYSDNSLQQVTASFFHTFLNSSATVISPYGMMSLNKPGNKRGIQQLCLMITILFCVPEVPCLDCPDWGFLWFSSVPVY